ncbi:MAG: D-alanyl-D-alanine carboxypeptidase [Chroococcopsis gigantea SAG 12.99]|jgi:D-alanyl-D-alanine carboxypeptidase/D-alanyl-D-alanine-endopeptidase (penicillin-binding protein 4)|nr:D-alanyl-D-alanine carboxypeptidase [Chroococcopsis gigantea SAG 12.99]
MLRRFLFPALSSGLILSSITVAKADSPICPADLPANINSILARPELRSSLWGILVQPLNSRENLYSLQSDKLFIPASNVKLLTTAAALLGLPPDYTIVTPVYIEGQTPRLTGLTIIGKGDPTITDETLQTLAQQLRAEGVTSIDNVRVDDGYFQSNINATWEWEDILFDYGVPASSLVLNRNSVTLKASPQSVGQPLELSWSDNIAARQWRLINKTLTTAGKTPPNLKIQAVLGSSTLIVSGGLPADGADDLSNIAIPDPSRYFLDKLSSSLQKVGISVKSVSVASNIPPRGEIFSHIPSLSLSQLITKVNKNSDNLLAETLLQLVGVKDGVEPIEAVKSRLSTLGLNSAEYTIKDGSGLSRQNFVSPALFVELLRQMSRTSAGGVYKDSLASGGKDGTLGSRFKDSALAVQAKTGTLSGVIALSGYVETADQGTVVFSTLVNNSNQPPAVVRKGIDEIIGLLVRLKTCPSNNSEKREEKLIKVPTHSSLLLTHS